ncbi:hypothetical protein VNO78_30531 [Psophocarpus tetragonolobus]|uniref:FAS1 domain-containing protein n=1 Tax=Psophocarpus tetragonolobus TaxID=3891 RepID=A0AAN9RXI2_PSOTE
MNSKGSSLLFLALFLASSSVIHGFDITKLLGENSKFSTFNKYLTEAKLADEINKRNTITVLAVANGAISSIAGKSPEAIKAIISTHVILDYFDEKKLMEAVGSKQPMTTLYQSSGLAKGKQGFIKVSLIGEGEIAFGSAENGAPADSSELMSTIHSEPYNVSILEVTKPIIVSGIDSSSTPSPAQSPKAPAGAAEAPAPAKATAAAPEKNAAAPSPSDENVAASPDAAANAPAESPIAAESPAGSPAAGPVASDAAGPAADDATAADVPAPSHASSIKMGLVGAIMAFASFFIV